jgi:alcohol dehydrogenase
MPSGLVQPAFEQRPGPHLVFGPGALGRLGEIARRVPAARALVVTDQGVAGAGHLQAARRLLEEAGVTVLVFDEVIPNPTTRCVEKCRDLARSGRIDVLVGLGGGSSLDTAKGCNFLLTNGGRMQDYWGCGKAAQPMLPFIAIPTTAGTGSECQSYALITDEHTHRKMACGDGKATARAAILDPLLTLSQPPGVARSTALDALAHAVESAVTTRRNAVSLLYAREAFALVVRAFPRLLARPEDLEARGDLLLGAAWAGTAIENSMLGAAHAAANPLTARFGVAHGEAVSLMLPWVVRFNAQVTEVAAIYARLADVAGLERAAVSPDLAGHTLAARIEELLRLAAWPRCLAERGVTEADLPALAQEAAQEWTGKFNPRPVTAADFEELYRAALC